MSDYVVEAWFFTKKDEHSPHEELMDSRQYEDYEETKSWCDRRRREGFRTRLYRREKLE